MTPCGMVTEPAVRPDKLGFSPAWDSLREKAAQIRLSPHCAACQERESCMTCAAVAFAETGCYHKKPDYMCRFTHAYREQITALAETL